jgi:regulator of protease activity HflC (stomatin/prohibitin superfamily)
MMTHTVYLPIDRNYAFRKGVPAPDRQGSLQTSGLVAGGRAVADRGYLKMGTHRFWPGVSVVECTRGQAAVTYWFPDDNHWEAIDKEKSMAPLRCSTREGVTVRLGLRVRFRIVDEDFWLLAIQKPAGYRHYVIGDVVTIVNDVIGRRSVYEFAGLFATDGREALRLEIQDLLREKLAGRHLELTETFLGPIVFPKDVAQGFADAVKSGAYAFAAGVAADGRAYANSVIQPTLTPEIIALAQAEAPLHAAWTQWAGPRAIETGQTVRFNQFAPPFPPPTGLPPGAPPPSAPSGGSPAPTDQ